MREGTLQPAATSVTGMLGSVVAALCCLGVPAMLSILGAIGLGFLVRDAILFPLLVVSLAVTIWGLWQGWRRHGHAAALWLGAASAAATLLFLFFLPALVSAALGGLVVASVLNVVLATRRGAVQR